MRMNHSLYQAAIAHFDEHNATDPNVERVNGVAHPRELLQAQRLTDWVLKLCPQAAEPLRLAARCQHLGRWQIPRDSYPMDRAGYLQWRTALKKFHAQKAGEILRQVGYADDIIVRVQNLNLKKNFPQDPESRVLEDGPGAGIVSSCRRRRDAGASLETQLRREGKSPIGQGARAKPIVRA